MKESPFIAVLKRELDRMVPGAFICIVYRLAFVFYLLYGYNFW